MEKQVKYNIENHVAYITIDNDKEMNALNEDIQHAILEYLEDARFNGEVRAIVLQAEGRIFSGGGNVNLLKAAVSDPVANAVKLDDALAQPGAISMKMRQILKPIVVSIQGAIAGAAANIALAGDFRIVSDDCQLIEAFVGVGLCTDGGGAYLLTRLIGAAKATEMIMLGKPVKADELARLNLVNKVVSREELHAETVKFAERLANGPSQTYRYFKELVNQAAYYDIATAFATEAEYQNNCARTQDCLEGLSSFLEKRKPNFQGR